MEALPRESPASRGARSRRLTLPRFWRLAHKELREILRDRRTIITLVLMPLLVYPLLAMAMNRFLLTSVDTLPHQPVYVIGVPSQQVQKEYGEKLLLGEEFLLAERSRQRGETTVSAPGGANDQPEVRFKILAELDKQVADGTIAAALEPEPPPRPGGEPLVRITHARQSVHSLSAAQYLQSRLDAFTHRHAQERLRAIKPYQPPHLLEFASVAPRNSSFSLATVVPLVLILMTITGAVYPAIDLTAGERERGTLETLIAAPVSRLGLLLAKYLAVLVVATLTATVNLVAMTVTISSTGLGPLLFGASGLHATTVAQVFSLLVLFAAFFSAVLLVFTSVARSFKEAQAYLVPMMLIALGPGILSLIPDLKFTPLLAITPLVNIVLLARDVLDGAVDATVATFAVVSTLVYTLAAVTLAARIFGADAVLYAAQSGWRDLLQRPAEPRSAPSLSGAMMCLATIFPVYFLAASNLASAHGLGMSEKITLAAVITAVLFGLFPAVAAVLYRVRLVDGFRLRRPRLLAIAASIVLGLTLWTLAHEVFLAFAWVSRALGVEGLSPSQFAQVRQMLATWRAELSPGVVVLALAVVPATFEELFFRGFLFRALENSLSSLQTVLLSAGLFGLFHVVSGVVLTPERFLPSALLGVCLGFVALRSGSVWPGMLVHVLHNGFLLLVAYYREEIEDRGWGLGEQSHLPPLVLGGGVVGLAVGLSLVWLAGLPPTKFEMEP